MKANYVLMAPLQIVDTSTIDKVTWTAVDAGGLTQACYLIKFYNNSANPVFVSMDGTNDCEYIPNGVWFSAYAESNAQKRDAALWRKGEKFFIRGVASPGTFTIAGYYQPQI
jgi:hypothetical protein